jgi:hypothetical protein
MVGGKASRVEVYGLFIAAIVLTGGGIGGAFAISASLDSNEQTIAEAPQDPSQTPSPDPSGDAIPASETSPPVAVPAPEAPVAVPAPADDPPASYEDVRIKEPYIGPADTFSYLSRGHICGWDTEALGGFGWGFDPAEPCSSLYVAYVGQHCEAGDGVVFHQRCDQYFSRTLPVRY